MRMSCNGCRVLRKGCSENCSIRPCLQWMKSPESQAHATVFLAKFYGRAGLLNLINSGPQHLRPAIFRSLLYEACGRIVNPIHGSVGLLWSGSWHLCQAAVEAVLRGAPITPINSEDAAANRHTGPPLKAYDIRHISKDETSAALGDQAGASAKSRSRVRRAEKSKASKQPPATVVEDSAATTAPAAADDLVTRSASHESSVSHQSDLATLVECGDRSKESESMVSAETTELFRAEPESVATNTTCTECIDVLELELTLGLEPVLSSANHVVPVKKRRIEACGFDDCADTCMVELGLA